MKILFACVTISATSLLMLGTSCHMRKAAGTKQSLSKSIVVPTNEQRATDTASRTPTPKIAPSIAPNVRPKPVPNPQPPVPPL